MTVKFEELIQESKAKLSAAQTILDKDGVTAEDLAQAKALREEAHLLNTKAGELKAIQDVGALYPDVDAIVKAGGHRQEGGEEPTFKTFADFLIACKNAHTSENAIVDKRLHTFEDMGTAGRDKKDLSSAIGASGGFLLSQEHYDSIMAVAAPLTVTRRRGALVLPMGSRTIDIPVFDQTATDGMAGGFFGGVQAYWSNEAGPMTQSAPTFRLSTLTAHELTAYAPIPNSLLEDVNLVSLTAWLAGEFGFPGAIAWKEDYAFLRGTGVGQPRGIIGAPGTLVVSRQSAGTVVYDDLVGMMVRHMGMNPVWVAHRMVLEKLLLMVGPDDNPLYLWGNAEKGVPNTLLGYPIEFVDKLPAVGSEGDIGLYDFRHYVIGDRQRTTVKFSDQFLFRNNMTAARAIQRVDGQPWLSAPVTFADGTTQISPFVVLGDASS